jgi:tetratricopeptide (TPR) repeat protein
MNAHARTLTLEGWIGALSGAALLLLILTASGCNKLKARDLLNKGVQEIEAGKYDAGIEDFKQAKVADPDLLNARVYLAVAYADEYHPGAPSDENVRIGQQALVEFQDVLTRAPNDLRAIDGIAKLLFQMASAPFDPGKYAESKKYYQRHIALKPDDSEPYYQIGVINWTLAHYANADLRLKYNQQNPQKQVKEADPLPDKQRADFAQQYGAMVEEGLQMMAKSTALRPDNPDAMAFQSLLLRQKADASDKATRDTLEHQADDLSQKVNVIKQRETDNPSKS